MHHTTLPAETRCPLDAKLFIDGRWEDALSGQTFETINPATETVLATVASADAADIDKAVMAARRAFDTGPWRRMSARDRGRCLYRLADLIERNLDELAMLESMNCGKPVTEARIGDLPLTIECLRYYAGWADKIHGETIPVSGPYFCHTRREPVGVVGQIVPWNFPLMLLAWKWGPALAAGCTTILKPAEQTPLTALRVAELSLEAGFPDGVINVVPGLGPQAGARLANHQGVDKIAFTGSTRVGQQIMQAAGASNLKRITLELGGKSPNIVFADADLDAAVAGVFEGAYLNLGQSCCAGSRIFVDARIRTEFVGRMLDRIKQERIGDPSDPATTQGTIISQAQFDKIIHYIHSGLEQGATLLTGGNRLGARGYFMELALFDEVSDDMLIAIDEIFGPVACILPFDSIDEVIRRANQTNYGMAAGVWTRNMAVANRMAADLRVGTVWVNCYDAVDMAAPYGGWKSSGLGRELGGHALAGYTETKTVTMSLK